MSVLAILPILALSSQQKRKRNPEIVDRFLVVSVSASSSTTCIQIRPCPSMGESTITLTANSTDPLGETLIYKWKVSGGRLSGNGRQVIWDLDAVDAGTYTATVEVSGKRSGTGVGTTEVRAASCGICDPPPPPCPKLAVSCQEQTNEQQNVTFSAVIQGEDAKLYPSPSFRWRVNAGRIVDGKFSQKLRVDPSRDATGFDGINATVEVGVGADPACVILTATCSAKIKSPL